MKRYIKLFTALVTLATKRYLENRINAITGILSSLVYFFITIFFISVIFSNTSSVQGWTKIETLLLLGIYKSTSSLFSLLCGRGINFIPRYIRQGDLDLLLIKPLNTQFFISFRFTRAWEILGVVSGLVLTIYSLGQLHLEHSFLNVLLLIGTLIFGLVILYGLYFSIATLSIFFKRFSSFSEICELISSPLSYPLDILGKNTSFALTFIIPLGFIVTVPIKIFLSKSPYYFGIYGLVFAVLFFTFSVWFWNFSLKHYTSASS